MNMEGGFADAYTWDAPSHVIESIDDFALDPQDNADQWFGKAFHSLYVYNIHNFLVPIMNCDIQKHRNLSKKTLMSCGANC